MKVGDCVQNLRERELNGKHWCTLQKEKYVIAAMTMNLFTLQDLNGSVFNLSIAILSVVSGLQQVKPP